MPVAAVSPAALLVWTALLVSPALLMLPAASLVRQHHAVKLLSTLSCTLLYSRLFALKPFCLRYCN
jgi:hypothetical protein